MAENETGLPGGAQTFCRGLETSWSLPALLRVHGAGRFALPGLGMKNYLPKEALREKSSQTPAVS
jgi:hypothetical protein